MKPKNVCIRCSEVFPLQSELMEHLRSDVPCPKKEAVPNPVGITEDQAQELKRKKRPGSNQTDVERWNEMYKILFPDDNHIPHPCMLQPN